MLPLAVRLWLLRVLLLGCKLRRMCGCVRAQSLTVALKVYTMSEMIGGASVVIVQRLGRPFVRGLAEASLGIFVFLAQKNFDPHALWLPMAVTTASVLLGSPAPAQPVLRTSRLVGFTTALVIASTVHLYPVLPLLFLIIFVVDIPRLVIGQWSKTNARPHSGSWIDHDTPQKGSDWDNAAHQKIVRQWWLNGR